MLAWRNAAPQLGPSMNFQNLMREVRKYGTSLQALAALGAVLRLQQGGDIGDPDVRDQLQEVVRVLGPSLLDNLTPQDRTLALGMIQIFFRDAAALLDRPERAAGWTYTDPQLLQLQGMLSRANVACIAMLCEDYADLAKATQQGGVFLDVGTGVAHLAIEAARTWRNMRVVGIDIWEPALALARENVANSDVGDRIELRKQNVLELADTDVYSIAWLPAPFIHREAFELALARVHRALKRGGWLIVGQYAIPDEPLALALARLQIVRSGGYPWPPQELSKLLDAHGYETVEAVAGPAGTSLLLGRRTGRS